jgi:class 3 adenylate cyclase
MLPARADHARAALRLGLDMHAAAASVDTGDGRGVQVRVGMHSGAVTSGVIGHVRARFCLFGGAPRDAVLSPPACTLTCTCIIPAQTL